ncbi:hypothetical protein [Pantanalinema sp. GBBB05]|uniref:hypothetical protein n=1 Tax=Pantanalinema sp. GBBB05 TaxID=2604139 RepID=UPI001E06B8A6|nr:hypothetical protein [Pantanalinema sp. GBBB05]
MTLNYWTERLSVAGRWMFKALLGLVAIALVWQSAFGLNTAATAAPVTLIAANTADQAQSAADKVRSQSKDFIRDTKNKVEKTANRNAAKVDQADDEGSFVERKARRDQARIEQRAEQDASRTEKAVDDSMNAVQGIVENIKGAFGQ